jgi:NAD(P)-dependent dehydrogenase (short-subunit alcohol dehydrogenase family)
VSLAWQQGLDGRIVLVSGAGRGIGRAVALAFAAAGAHTIALARTPADLDALVAEVRA